MSSLFKDDAARQRMEKWFDTFRAEIPAATQTRTVPTRFGDAHVLVGGPEQAPPVVVLHGAMASSAHGLRELAPLLERFRVYAVDVVGQSPKSADTQLDVSNDDYGHWLSEVMTGLGLSRAGLVGVSWGGFVCLRLAAVAPERIERLALLVPAGMVTGPAWEGFRRVAWPMMLYRWFPSQARRDRFVSNLLTTKGDAWTDYLGDAFLSYRMNMRIPRLATPEELARFEAPTLVLGADDDVSFPGAAVAARAQALFAGHVETEVIAGSHHCPPTTDAFRGWLGERLGRFLLPG